MSVKKSNKLIFRLVLSSILLSAVGYVSYSEFFKGKEVTAAKVGSVAPDFSLKNLNGTEKTLTDYRGKGVLINFWATYCPPCKKEMPYLENAYQKYKEQGVEILAVNVTEPTRLVNQFISQKNITFPILLDRDGLVLDKYQVQNLPITFFINSKGEIMNKVSGELTEEKIEEGLELIKP
ncbi:thiol-disulfide oxidoreductase ResA [Peribacillus loiseleuriae]|uniref:thiol-disulfide oxidoreductase ResA n=1 Tax=Peribacillus loiseleuriae TaxID=1679170 RepID=UPI003D043D32